MITDPPPPHGVDVTKPSTARMYDYWLGGKDHFAVDRAAALQVEERTPEVPVMARENRKFLQRAVRAMAKAGICQFVDIGTGLPTQGNVHEIAQAINPHARTAYVDNDAIVLAHARALKDDPNTITIAGDLRSPEQILADPEIRRLIDFRQPVGVLLVAVLHFITDEENPERIVAQLRAAMAPGSQLCISQITNETRRSDQASAAAAVYDRASSTATLRSREQIKGFFGDFEVVDPGVVAVADWRPDTPYTGDPDQMWLHGGVGVAT